MAASSVFSSEAWDVLYWAMRPPLYRRIHMVIEIASEVDVFFCIVNFVVVNNLR
jgi:hypothetical protein